LRFPKSSAIDWLSNRLFKEALRRSQLGLWKEYYSLSFLSLLPIVGDAMVEDLDTIGDELLPKLKKPASSECALNR
jgi:hypothetical protein